MFWVSVGSSNRNKWCARVRIIIDRDYLRGEEQARRPWGNREGNREGGSRVDGDHNGRSRNQRRPSVVANSPSLCN